MREYNFDGIVGMTHSYGGLSLGNVASEEHEGQPANPKAAALQGLGKMRFIAQLGVGQAVLPPQPRPDVRTLRRLGFSGNDQAVLEAARKSEPRLLRACSSASAMWTANAATVAPSADTEDGRLHLTAANLNAMFHRSLEGPVTARVLSAIFADARCFAVHPPLPAGEYFSDEGAANHSRLCTERGALHLFGWGRRASGDAVRPQRYPARQTFEASASVARLNSLSDERVLLWQQSPRGIDVGAFHSDVLAVGNERLFIVHEHAFVDLERLRTELQNRLGPELVVLVATDAELPAEQAVAAYPFNSQIVTLPDGAMVVIAPRESRETEAARLFLERVAAESGLVKAVHYVDVNASMNNGGGPACLRLRVAMTDEERARISARVFFDEVLYEELVGWVERHYRDRLADSDLADPRLLDETRRALDELCSVLGLGSIYDFQRP